jgi:hypothetical protein
MFLGCVLDSNDCVDQAPCLPGPQGASARLTACPFRISYPDVLVVQPGQDWDGDNDTGPLDRAAQRRILAQRQVRAHLIVIRHIRSKNSPQVRFTKDQHSIDALAAHGADQAFRIPHFATAIPARSVGHGCPWPLPGR